MSKKPEIMPKTKNESPIKVTSFTTPKGQEVWYVHSDIVPLIALSFISEGGANYDKTEKNGTAQMMASLLDEGAGTFSSEEFHEKMAERAIEMSFSASKDSFSGSLKVLEDHAEEAFELLRLALQEPTFKETAVERIRSQILAGLKQQQNEPSSIASRLFFSKAFPNHPYGLNSSGTLDSIPKISREDLIASHKDLVGKGRLIIAAAGSLPQEKLAALIDKAFGDLPVLSNLIKAPQVTMSHIGEQFIQTLDVPQSHIRFGFNGIPRQDDDFVAAYVFNHIFGGGSFTSRLFNEVREKRGLAYGIGTGLASMRSTAFLTGSTATKNESVGECLKVIQQEIKKILSEEVPANELQKAKDYLLGSYMLAFDTSTKLAYQISELVYEGLGVDYISKREQLIQSVSGKDIKRVAERILGDGRFLSIIVGKPEGIKE